MHTIIVSLTDLLRQSWHLHASFLFCFVQVQVNVEILLVYNSRPTDMIVAGFEVLGHDCTGCEVFGHD